MKNFCTQITSFLMLVLITSTLQSTDDQQYSYTPHIVSGTLLAAAGTAGAIYFHKRANTAKENSNTKSITLNRIAEIMCIAAALGGIGLTGYGTYKTWTQHTKQDDPQKLPPGAIQMTKSLVVVSHTDGSCSVLINGTEKKFLYSKEELAGYLATVPKAKQINLWAENLALVQENLESLSDEDYTPDQATQLRKNVDTILAQIESDPKTLATTLSPLQQYILCDFILDVIDESSVDDLGEDFNSWRSTLRSTFKPDATLIQRPTGKYDTLRKTSKRKSGHPQKMNASGTMVIKDDE